MSKIKLGDITKIRTGKLDANASSENGKYPFFTCSKDPLRIDSYSYDCECVLVAGNGDLNVKYYKGKFDAYQRTYIIEDNSKGRLFIPYLYYFLELYVEELRKQSIGGVIKYIKLGNLTDAIIELPSIEKQKEIVNILNKSRKIVESKNVILQSYDQLIKSRFVEMFEYIDLRKNQNNWVKLGDITKIVTGTTPSTNDESNWGREHLWITPAELDDSSFYVYNTERKLTDKGMKSKSLNKMPINTVLLSTRAPIGKTAIVGSSMACNQGFKNFVCKDTLDPIYLFILLKYNKEYLNSIGSGTTFKEISKTAVSNIEIPVPNIELQNKFAEFVKQVDKLKFVVQKSLNETQELFDSLMQKYFG
jgi:type I restriction enzyme S subunit